MKNAAASYDGLSDSKLPLRVLIAEDSPTQALKLKAQVESIANGYNWEADVVTRASEVVSTHHEYDCVLLDLTLDDSTKDQTIAIIPDIVVPVVVHTAHSDRKTLTALRKVGVTQVVYKSGRLQSEQLRQSLLMAAGAIELSRVVKSLGELG